VKERRDGLPPEVPADGAAKTNRKRKMGRESANRNSRREGVQLYVTTDLNLASFLASRGFDPLRVEPPPGNSFPKFAAFVFERTEGLSEAVIEWTANSPLSTDLRSFLEKRREFLHWARSVARGGAR